MAGVLGPLWGRAVGVELELSPLQDLVGLTSASQLRGDLGQVM